MSSHHPHLGCACCNYQLFGHAVQGDSSQSEKGVFNLDKLLIAAEHYIDDYIANKFVRPPQQHKIFFGGTIRTLENGDVTKTVEAVVIKHGQIVHTGSRDQCQSLYPDAGPEDLQGACLLPGLIEPHVHLTPTASFNAWVQLAPFRQGVESGGDGDDQYLIGRDYNKQSVCTTLIEAARELPKNRKWLLAFGVDPSQFNPITTTSADGTVSPTPWQDFTKEDLDKINDQAGRKDLCIFIMNASGHVAYVNTNALNATKQSTSGNGILLESDEIGPVIKIALEQYFLEHPKGFTDLFGNLQKIFKLALSRGVTLMWDAALGASLKNAELEILSKMATSGLAELRLGGALFYTCPDQWTKITPTKPAHYHTDWFNIANAKIVSDGSNQGLTGYQLTKYQFPDSNINDTYPNGVWNFNPPGGEADHEVESPFRVLVTELVERGWPLMIHANGTHAINNTILAYRDVLNNQEKSGLEKRHRIEHASLLSDQNLADMEYLGLSPSFLIGHVGYWGYTFKRKVFPEQPVVEHLDRTASASQHALRYTLHSDHFVSPIGPLRMMEQAVTRMMEDAPEEAYRNGHPPILNEQECATMAQALRAATYDAAWQCHMDHLIGELVVGKQADLTILDEDPLTRPAEGLRDVPVHQTWVNGRLCYPR
ncbi:amidohydrolase family protein [Pseudoalteromonas rubra]|uniref:Amidohydrolase family protein n=1 Tax=Pseudoalteromonas rubra TaxID=43658 RepID=A0A5S3UUE0_9GAMM|nr:amidohydrolase family protein [Pseudoalteromonas rubra]QPB82698.1 amidohydrolase family protein [Pseudoalteromonas rubra]